MSKKYRFTVEIRTHLLPKDIIWSLTNKMKSIFPIIKINYEELEDYDNTELDTSQQKGEETNSKT